MKLKTLLTGIIVSGSLGMAPGVVQGDGDTWRHDEQRVERFEPRSGDDSALAPHIGDPLPNAPHIGDPLPNEMSESDAMQVEEALAQRGYDPGAVDGMIDDDSRAAIREFQDDHQLAVTGTIDPQTGDLLGVVVFESS